MATETKYVKSGGWRTLERFWNATGTAYFVRPSGTKIRVRYGAGFASWNSQKQTLDGINTETLSVGKTSIAYARMQIKVSASTDVTYQIHP